MQNIASDDKPIAAYELNYVHDGKQLSNITKFYKTDNGIIKSFNLGGDGVCRDVLSHTTEKDMIAEFRNVVKSSENYSVLSFPVGFTMTEADFKSDDSKVNIYQDMMDNFNDIQHRDISKKNPFDALDLVKAIRQYVNSASDTNLTRAQHNDAAYEVSRCIALSKAEYNPECFKQDQRCSELPEGEIISRYTSDICSRITDTDNSRSNCHSYMAKLLNASSLVADKTLDASDKAKFFDEYFAIVKSDDFTQEAVALHKQKMNSLCKDTPERDIMDLHDSDSDEFESDIKFEQ